MARSTSKRKRSVVGDDHATNTHAEPDGDTTATDRASSSETTVTDKSEKPTIKFTGKRQRPIPKSIGGGKGDLQPPTPLKRSRRTRSTPTAVDVSDNSSGADGAGGSDVGRVLRSQGTTKINEYEEEFFQRKEEFDYDLRIMINSRGPQTNGHDDASASASEESPPEDSSSRTPLVKIEDSTNEEQEMPQVTPVTHMAVEKVDLGEELRKSKARHTRFMTDPLDDGVYIAAHRGEAKKEKRARNLERDRLAHNAQMMEQDLEKLRSPGSGWIKAIGLSNAVVASFTKQELNERKRRLMTYLESTLEKYKAWREDERRKKLGRLSSSPKDSQERETIEPEVVEEIEEAEDEEEDEEEDEGIGSQYEEIEEAPKSSRRAVPGKRSAPSPQPQRKTAKRAKLEDEEFTSFYDKAYKRQQAVGGTRKSARTLTAFGEPLPDIEPKEFGLPADIIASSARYARARKRLSR